MTPRAMTHTHVLVHTYTQSYTDASIAVTRPAGPLVCRHSQNGFMDQRDWDRIPRRILALCAHGDGGRRELESSGNSLTYFHHSAIAQKTKAKPRTTTGVVCPHFHDTLTFPSRFDISKKFLNILTSCHSDLLRVSTFPKIGKFSCHSHSLLNPNIPNWS